MTVALAPSFRRSIAAGNARHQARPAIYYIRHGLTDWNVAQRLQGRHDVPLNAAGCAQAACCAAILQDLFRREGRAPESFDYVSSPLVRARATMEIVRAALGLEPAGYAIAGQLAEIAFGEWEGLTYAQVMARDKQVIAARESDKWSFAPPGGESYAQVAVRIRHW
jgi:broad specificity phosphatase PhoE